MIEKKVGPLYQAYGKDAPRDRLPLLFQARHGYRPQEVKDAKTVWLVGPIAPPPTERLTPQQEPQRTGGLLRAVAQVGDRVTPERARFLVGEQLPLFQEA